MRPTTSITGLERYDYERAKDGCDTTKSGENNKRRNAGTKRTNRAGDGSEQAKSGEMKTNPSLGNLRAHLLACWENGKGRRKERITEEVVRRRVEKVVAGFLRASGGGL